MIRISCTCGAAYQVKPEIAGKQVRCKQCSATFTVPQENPVTATTAVSSETVVAQQKPPPSFQKQAKTPEQLKKEREEALLAGYTSKPARQSLDERIAERHTESIERDRLTNAIKFGLIGVLCIAAAVVTFIIFRSLDDGGVAPIIVWVLKWIGGKYWIPPLLALIGIWQIVIAVSSLFKVVDIVDETIDQL